MALRGYQTVIDIARDKWKAATVRAQVLYQCSREARDRGAHRSSSLLQWLAHCEHETATTWAEEWHRRMATPLDGADQGTHLQAAEDYMVLCAPPSRKMPGTGPTWH